jgi:hypothetical protein
MPHVPDPVPGKRVTDAGARTEGRGQPSNIRGGSRMQESCPYGPVRGAPSNGCPYRNRTPAESPCKPDALDQVDFGLLLRWLKRLLCALLRALLAASPPAQIA